MALDGIIEELDCEKQVLGLPGSPWVIFPRHLGVKSVVYSFGVGTNIDFDLALIQMFGVRVHAFDPTPRCLNWISSQDLPEEFVFHDYGLAATDGSIKFFPPRKESSAHFTPVKRYAVADEATCVECPVHRLGFILRELGHSHVDLIKMDIEGGEYDVIDDMIKSGIGVGQILIEFHHCYPTISYEKTRNAVRKLKDAGYRIFYISKRTYEMSFLHSDVKIM